MNLSKLISAFAMLAVATGVFGSGSSIRIEASGGSEAPDEHVECKGEFRSLLIDKLGFEKKVRVFRDPHKEAFHSRMDEGTGTQRFEKAVGEGAD